MLIHTRGRTACLPVGTPKIGEFLPMTPAGPPAILSEVLGDVSCAGLCRNCAVTPANWTGIGRWSGRTRRRERRVTVPFVARRHRSVPVRGDHVPALKIPGASARVGSTPTPGIAASNHAIRPDRRERPPGLMQRWNGDQSPCGIRVLSQWCGSGLPPSTSSSRPPVGSARARIMGWERRRSAR